MHMSQQQDNQEQKANRLARRYQQTEEFRHEKPELDHDATGNATKQSLGSRRTETVSCLTQPAGSPNAKRRDRPEEKKEAVA